MSDALLASKVAIREEQPRIRTIDAVQTSIVAAVGVTERGPVAEPTLVTSFEEYREVFGGFTTDSDVALAAQGFFENEGQFLYVVRTVHFTDPADAGTKTSAAASLTLQTPTTSATAGSLTGSETEPFDLEPGDDLDISVDGGATQTATFNATAAAETSGNTEPFALADGDTLTVDIDGDGVQTIDFLAAEFNDIGAATAAEVAAVINGKIQGASASVSAGAVVITSDTRGTASSVEVTGGTANAVGKLNFPTDVNTGTGDVADIDAVTAAEAVTVLNAALAGATASEVSGAVKIESDTTGASSSILVEASSTADDELGFDNATHTGSDGTPRNTLDVNGKTDGTYAHNLKIKIEDATSGDSDEFNLVVLDEGLEVETFPNLSMLDTADRYVESIINDEDSGSTLVSTEDLDASGAQRPANGTFGPLSGGDDGLTGIVDNDFIGDAGGGTGIRALDTVQDGSILTVPGKATSAIHNAMITYCEDTRDLSMFAILDPPESKSATEIITYAESTAAILGLSEFAALYWPRVEVLNPSTSIFGNVKRITVPPSGILAGIYARTDASREGGVYDPPAGEEKGIMRGVLGFETDEVLDEAKRDLVYPKRINPLMTGPGLPRMVDGSKTLKGNGNFPYVSQRRGAIFIEQSIKNGTQFARHQNNTPGLRRVVSRSIRSFLLTQLRNGAFSSEDPDQAFFVDFSDKLNPASVVNAAKMIGRVGLAFNTPADFIVIRFSRDTRALEQEQAG